MQIKVALTLIYAKRLGLVANRNKQNAKPSQDVRLNLCAHRVCVNEGKGYPEILENKANKNLIKGSAV